MKVILIVHLNSKGVLLVIGTSYIQYACIVTFLTKSYNSKICSVVLNIWFILYSS